MFTNGVFDILHRGHVTYLARARALGAALLVALQGSGWLQSPTLWPALAFGVGTGAVPLFVMQPAMGLGFAARKTPAPLKNCARSLTNHAVFGAGLYLAAAAVQQIGR